MNELPVGKATACPIPALAKSCRTPAATGFSGAWGSPTTRVSMLGACCPQPLELIGHGVRGTAVVRVVAEIRRPGGDEEQIPPGGPGIGGQRRLRHRDRLRRRRLGLRGGIRRERPQQVVLGPDRHRVGRREGNGVIDQPAGGAGVLADVGREPQTKLSVDRRDGVLDRGANVEEGSRRRGGERAAAAIDQDEDGRRTRREDDAGALAGAPAGAAHRAARAGLPAIPLAPALPEAPAAPLPAAPPLRAGRAAGARRAAAAGHAARAGGTAAPATPPVPVAPPVPFAPAIPPVPEAPPLPVAFTHSRERQLKPVLQVPLP